MNPLGAVVSLHLLHALRYRPLDPVDWLHHVTMIGIVAPLGYCVKGGRLLGHALFYLSGLPGSISYVMLLLVRLRYMSSSHERHLSAAINLWLRGPGLSWHAMLSAIAFIETLKGRVIQGCLVPKLLQPGAAAVLALGALWNGQYFMNLVIRSSERLLQ